eukprot:TRINITY_DN5281_c0_g1_i1.p1 TRINITY_DN5281_c0_g1~~TRINITY_DN5281_c0_g1_i1.p1  ORF type:complete len:304 (-),score=42.73 TRINITY_DN5281_c0_g1_i1:29-940(-)
MGNSSSHRKEKDPETTYVPYSRRNTIVAYKGPNHFLTLPDEICREVFKHLVGEDLFSVRLVSKKWKKIVGEISLLIEKPLWDHESNVEEVFKFLKPKNGVSDVQILNLSTCYGLTEENTIEIIQKSKLVKSFMISKIGVFTPKILEALTQCKNLTKLVIMGKPLSPSVLNDIFERLPNLTSFGASMGFDTGRYVNGRWVNYDNDDKFQKIESHALKELRVHRRSPLNHLELICPNVEKFSLYGEDDRDDYGNEVLGVLKQVLNLRVLDCRRGVSSESVAHIANFYSRLHTFCLLYTSPSPRDA